MPSHRVSAFFLSLLAVAGVAAQSPSYPSAIVDAQIPLVSSDGFSAPQGVAASGGVVYVADTGKQRILRFPYGGAQKTVSLGSFGPALQRPAGVALDGGGNLYVTDTDTNRLIKLRAPVGTLSGLTIMGSGVLDRPTAVASDAAGNLAVINSGNGTIVARRSGGTPFVFGTGATVLVAPTAVSFDNLGNLYVADAGDGGRPSAIYRFPKLGGTGVNLAPAGYDLKNITGLALDNARNLFVLDGGSRQLIEVPANGSSAFLVPQSNFVTPDGLAIDNIGNLYVADAANTVTKLAYNNAADFGSVWQGSTSAPITFNYEFYQATLIKARRGIGGGVWNAEYKVAGGTCSLRTYYPSTSGVGLTLPAICTTAFTFTPSWVNGRPGAVQMETSNGKVTQLAFGTGRGAQLAVFNAAVSDKFAGQGATNAVVNAANTLIYFSGAGGTYRQPVTGGASSLVSTYRGKLAIDGAGDLYIFTGAEIVRVPADGSTPLVTSVASIPGTVRPISFGLDPNGAIYIADQGKLDEYGGLSRGFVLRVSSRGDATKIYPDGFVSTPNYFEWNYSGELFFVDSAQRSIYGFNGLRGDFQLFRLAPTIGGLYGVGPDSLAVDDTQTPYYWDALDFGWGFGYAPPLNMVYPNPIGFGFGTFRLPLYTVPGVYRGNYFPFMGAAGEQALITSPSGKMYGHDAERDVWHLIDRTHGLIPKEAFDPNFQWTGGPTQRLYLYNLGNEPLTFTGSTLFTESGNGVGSFAFGATSDPYSPPACIAGATVAPGGVCQIDVTSVNGYGSGPAVTDTLHFLTDAINNAAVSFTISGAGSPAH